MKAYPFALFDMDGTLVDSMGYWRQVFSEYAAMHGKTLTAEQSAQLSGAPGYAAVRRLLSCWGIEVDPEELPRACERLMGQHYAAEIEAKTGIPALLKELREAGTRMAVLTLTPHREAEICLRKTELAPYFSFVLTPEDTPGHTGKENPDIFRLALDKLGCDNPANCAFYEDSLYAIRTAKAMGFPVFAVADKWAARDEKDIRALADEYLVF